MEREASIPQASEAYLTNDIRQFLEWTTGAFKEQRISVLCAEIYVKGRSERLTLIILNLIIENGQRGTQNPMLL